MAYSSNEYVQDLFSKLVWLQDYRKLMGVRSEIQSVTQKVWNESKHMTICDASLLAKFQI